MEKNELYPIFLKTSAFKTLIVGGGEVAEEKLHFLLKSSPASNVKMVATFFRPATSDLASRYGVEMVEKAYEDLDLEGVQLVIAATNFKDVNNQVYTAAKAKGVLVNVADTPELCDFYMGGIVTKGNIKLAISTNGKSPTLAKRLRQFFEEVLPEDLTTLADNLNDYRKRLKDDFEYKVAAMNRVTAQLNAEEKIID